MNESTSQALPPTRGHLAIWIVVPVAVTLALLLILLATRDSAQERNSRSPLLGELAPAIVGTTTTGEAFDLDDLRGTWVVVNFFSTNCVPCRVEHPELISFSERHAEVADASVVSVVFDDSVANVETFFAENGGEWPVLAEGSSDVAVAYGITGVPESYLLAPSGLVVWKYIGGVEADALDRVIDQIEGQA